MIYDILTLPAYEFLRNAFILSALASISFGLIGVFVVVRRIGYLAGAISHCAFGGVGLGLWLKKIILLGGFGLLGKLGSPSLKNLSDFIDPTWTAVGAAVLAALLIGVIRRAFAEREDTLIGIVWSVGMAIGLLFLDKTPGYASSSSVSSYLFGDIILISRHDMYTVAFLAVLVLVVTACCFKKFQAICFDEEFAKMRNIPVNFYFQVLLVLTAITVVLMLRVVGMVLVIALLTLPGATAAQMTRRLGPMILLSIILCFLASWLGIFLGTVFNVSVGPMIIVVISMIYILVCIVKTNFLRLCRLGRSAGQTP
ncbi:MAG: metal ABC transporter permease [Thermoguttaceae bacterium]|nr:metal ABC transporter permease [Thermoguttaceae bacterium]